MDVRLHVLTLPRVLFSAAACLQFASGIAHAQSDVDRLAAEPWLGAPFEATGAEIAAAARKLPQPEDADIEVLLEEARHIFSDDGAATMIYRQVYRILTPTGLAGWSVTRAPWSPWTEHRPEVRARVIKPDGGVIPFDPDTLADVPVASSMVGVWIDRRAVEAPLPGLRVGVIVEEETIWRTKPPPLRGGALRSWYLGGHAPVRVSRLTVDTPVDMNLQFVRRRVDKEVRVTSDGVRKVLKFEGGPYPAAVEAPEALPYDVARQRRISYSTGRSWKQIASEYSSIVDARVAPADLSELAEVARKAGDDPVKRVAAALAEVHRQVRYSGVHFGEAAIMPADPSETLSRGFGDCKDKSVLLVGILRTLKIDAAVALLRGGPGEDTLAKLPSLGAFDHAIVYLPKLDLWIDPTDPFAAVGELPTPVLGRLALVASPDTVDLISTPEPTPMLNVKHEEVEYRLAPSGSPAVRVKLTMSGAFKRTYRRRHRRAGDKIMLEALQGYGASGFGLIDVQGRIVRDYDPASPQRIILESDLSTFGTTGRQSAHVTIPDLGLFSDLPSALRPGDDAAARARTEPVRLAVPYRYEFTLRVKPGPGLSPPMMPADEHLRWGPATLDRTSTVGADGTATVTVAFSSGGPLLSAAEAEEIRHRASEYSARPPLTVQFDKLGSVALAAGRLGDAIRVMRKLAQAHPGTPELRADLISALLVAGYGDEARGEATRLVEEDDRLALGHQMLGWTMQHDVVGRDLSPGMERAAALAAYRRSLALDPTDPLPLPFVCGLLERDAAGLRFTPDVDMSAAAECRLSMARPSEDNYDAERTLQALAWAGRFEDLIREGEELPRTDLGDALRVAATAITAGVTRAAATAGRLVPRPETRRRLLDETRKALFRLGHYSEGVRWLNHVGGGPDLGRAEVATLRRLKVRPTSELVASKDPADAWKAVTALWMAPGFDRDQVLQRFTPGLRSRLQDRQAYRTVVGAWAGWAHTRPDADLVAAVSRDLAVSAGSPRRVDGNRRRGWSLRLPLSHGGPVRDSYVVPTPKGPRIAAVRGLVDSAGDEALRRLGAGDREVAEGLLGWASSMLPDRPGAARHREFKDAMRAGSAKVPREVAATLLAGPRSPAAAEILRATDGSGDETGRFARTLRRVRAYALADLGRSEEILRLLPDDPSTLDGEEAVLRLDALRRLGKGKEATTLSRQILAQPDPPADALRWAWDRAAAMGSFKRAEELRRRLFDATSPTPADLQSAAWQSLFVMRPDPDASSWARQSNDSLGEQAPEGLLTEALLIVDDGDLRGARLLRDKARALRPTEPADARLWLVQGRLSDRDGLPTMARRYYQRAIDAGADRADGPAALAERWLKGMGRP